MSLPPEPRRESPAGADPRTWLAERRLAARLLHESGGSGSQVCSALTALCDDVILAVYRQTLEEIDRKHRRTVLRRLALVATGGYARAHQAPYSDVDLLFLHEADPPEIIRAFVSRIVPRLWDAGLKLSHQVRSPADCIAFARRDVPARTSLIETRLLAGQRSLLLELQRRVHRLMAALSLPRFISEALAQREPEHRDYFADSVYLLEPHIKKSPGGLRDLHLFRWVAILVHGVADPDMLRLTGIISHQDARTLIAADEFLRRLRNEMHFHAGLAQDVLTREEQIRLARWLRFEDGEGLLAVERFMRHYYRLTTDLHDVMLRFVERAVEPSRLRKLLNRITCQYPEPHIRLTRDAVALSPQADGEVLEDGETLLKLFDLARRRKVRIEQDTLERIRESAPACRMGPAARRLFLRHLADPIGLGGYLRQLHRIGLLERLLPGLAHACGLIQFNLCHHYTVDEHSIRAVEAATRRLEDAGVIGQAYREIQRKDLLHLALLLHDLGKGYQEDHSEVGRRLAEEAARTFELDDEERRLLVFLVHRHLLMAYTAFRRDLEDIPTLIGFAREVGNAETLRKLFVLTAADTEAVSPVEWTGWKEELLTRLYLRTWEDLTGVSPLAEQDARVQSIRERLRERLAASVPADILNHTLPRLPGPYLTSTPPETIAEDLLILHQLGPGEVRVTSQYWQTTGLTRYSVYTWDDLAPGIFSRIAGALAAAGFQITDARIFTLDDGLVMDFFSGVDAAFRDEPPPDRRREIARSIEQVLTGQVTVEELLARRSFCLLDQPRMLVTPPPQVEIDNLTSDRFTIIEVFARDRLGLLYDIARTLFACGLSVQSARIATHIDQIVDVFYVCTADYGKLTDPEQLARLRELLLDAVESPLGTPTPASRAD